MKNDIVGVGAWLGLLILVLGPVFGWFQSDTNEYLFAFIVLFVFAVATASIGMSKTVREKEKQDLLTEIETLKKQNEYLKQRGN